ncbi:MULTISPECIES: DUF305 domain-containing protein [Mycolicibacterium]|jgi:uncharacterized protein (DUF305 family)|uniref:Lipoprotein n=2 Tax=Mycolicibacterium TaxID=1866885 RepID=A0A378SY54_9MYCO|nr:MULTISPECIES: DUF305 domain-containing protein [Mycolicibacterium]KLI05474.1 lipoprotein [Mycolicibacterium senegalense]KLO54328.1 lipoprotein [Mycolicibacterium senegalense]KMV16019.1 lipoprotein [Mycolicibacterium conceptionense]MCV7335192.1 DUF305 domain-containing protein [Mycolicibacterium senegalense]MDR7289145.1 uncharacterized protein (DUF305 family) [Mycolicibacterium senegalense]
MSKLTMLSAGALVAAALVAGCSNQSTDGATTSTSPTSAAASSPSAAEAHNDADVMFSQHMIPHHQQAVEMSDVLLAKQGIDPRVTDLATQIKGAQAPEIEQMQGWLKQWGNPPMPPMPQPGHGDMGHGDMPAMQGMVSEADMTALRNAQGAEAAKLYLTHMIAHHEGAITMAQDEIKDGQYPAAVELAHAIVDTQQQEIDTMRQILGSL